MTDKVKIFDTTLRDGEQSPGAALTINEKVEIAKQLNRLNVDIIVAGFPVSSKEQFEAVKIISESVDTPIAASFKLKISLRPSPIIIDSTFSFSFNSYNNYLF